MNALCIIPARGGSQGIPDKNLQPVGGISLIRRAVRAAKASACALTVVSSDDERIAQEARAEGVLAIDRAPETATDEASSESCLLDALERIDGNWDVIVMVQCTAPFVEGRDIDGCLERIREGCDSAFAGCRFHHFLWVATPLGMAAVNHDESDRPRRQDLLRREFLEAGSVYAMRTDGLLRCQHRFFGRIGCHELPAGRVLEIDSPADLLLARAMVDARIPDRPSVVYVDIDGTICCSPPDGDYRRAVPVPEKIAAVNALRRAGHTVIYWTARGTLSGTDHEDLTRRQLAAWGAEFDALRTGKATYDLLYDDRARRL